jgi:hypothetical protein
MNWLHEMSHLTGMCGEGHGSLLSLVAFHLEFPYVKGQLKYIYTKLKQKLYVNKNR